MKRSNITDNDIAIVVAIIFSALMFYICYLNSQLYVP